jgi:hypothetical protein
MAEAEPTAPKAIIELCGVVQACQERIDGGIVVRANVHLPGRVAVEFLVPDGQLAVLRYADEGQLSDAPTDDSSADERVEFVGGTADQLDESCFCRPERSGGLRIINPERAQTEYWYLGGEEEKLDRIESGNLRVSLEKPRRRPGRGPLRPQARHDAWQRGVQDAMWHRQRGIIARICTLASVDTIHGVFDPATARHRATSYMDDVDDSAT